MSDSLPPAHLGPPLHPCSGPAPYSVQGLRIQPNTFGDPRWTASDLIVTHLLSLR